MLPLVGKGKKTIIYLTVAIDRPTGSLNAATLHCIVFLQNISYSFFRCCCCCCCPNNKTHNNRQSKIKMHCFHFSHSFDFFLCISVTFILYIPSFYSALVFSFPSRGKMFRCCCTCNVSVLECLCICQTEIMKQTKKYPAN